MDYTKSKEDRPLVKSLECIPAVNHCHKPEGVNHINIVGYLDCYEVKTNRRKHCQEEDEIDRSYGKFLPYSPPFRNRYAPHKVV